MAGFGCIPSNNEWEHRTYDSNSTATFVKGSLVNLTPRRFVKEFSSTDSQFLGVALHNSANSLPPGKCVIAIPKPGATMWIDTATNVAGSAMSLGQAVTIVKSGNTVSTADFAPPSTMSTFGVVMGPVDSDLSRIEIALVSDGRAFYSGSTVTVAS
jgi:predicted NAD/FAD-dependent oxidoreductase